MAVTPLFTRADLDRNYTSVVIDRLCDDDGTGAGISTVVDSMIQSASAEVYGWLRAAYSTEAVLRLAQDDPSIVDKGCAICIAKMAERKQEFLSPDGKTLYSQKAADAVAYLKAIKSAQIRPAGEAGPSGAGANGLVPSFTNRDRRALIFQSDVDHPRGKGGF